MSDPRTASPLAVLPPFTLPDQRGAVVNTAHLRGRRNLVLLLLPMVDADTSAYLAAFAARREEWAWLHTAVLVIVPEAATMAGVASCALPVLRDPGAVRATLLPDAEANIAALLVADTTGHITEWFTPRRIGSLPEVDTVLAWAWDVARPRGACDGGVAWARPAVAEEPPPAPIGHFTIGARRRERSRYRGAR